MENTPWHRQSMRFGMFCRRRGSQQSARVVICRADLRCQESRKCLRAWTGIGGWGCRDEALLEIWFRHFFTAKEKTFCKWMTEEKGVYRRNIWDRIWIPWSISGKGICERKSACNFWLYEKTGRKKIYAGTAKNNLPSVGLLNSVGFQLVGTERISFHKDSEGNDIYFEGGNFVKELCWAASCVCQFFVMVEKGRAVWTCYEKTGID